MSETSLGTIRIALVESEPAARLGICRYLEQFPEMQILRELDFPDRSDALFQGRPPNVALIDCECDGGGGLQLIRRACLGSPRFPCVAWIRRDQSAEVLRAIKAGARAVICRRDPLSEVAIALRAAHGGGTHLSPIAAAAVGDGLWCAGGFGEPNAQLPGRQQQVFRMLGDGVAALDIADRMGISLKTVHTHIERLKHRMNCPNKAVLCRLAAIESAREGTSSTSTLPS